MKILVVEDDQTISLGLKHALSQRGHDVSLVFTVQQALVNFSAYAFDLVLLDLGLPDGSGYDVLSIIRAKSDVAVIVLTARDDSLSVLKGFDYGADDYVTKPFKVEELTRRIDAISKRTNMIHIGDLIILINEGKVLINGESIYLSVIEYQLLLKLARNRDVLISREELIEQVWGTQEYVSSNTLSVNIKRLRERLNDVVTITAVPGKGYILSCS